MKDVMRNLLLDLVGCPYRIAGETPWSGFCATGFAVWVLALFGVIRDSYPTPEALSSAVRVFGDANVDSCELGDLVFYSSSGSTPNHVMVALGGGFVIGPATNDTWICKKRDAYDSGAIVRMLPINYRPDVHHIARTSMVLEAQEREIAKRLIQREGLHFMDTTFPSPASAMPMGGGPDAQ